MNAQPSATAVARTTQPYSPRILAVLAATALAAAGCSRQAPPPAAKPVEVGVVTVTPTSVTLTKELPGRTSAFRVAEVRARVNGIVLRRLFTEGADVKETRRESADAKEVAARVGVRVVLRIELRGKGIGGHQGSYGFE